MAAPPPTASTSATQGLIGETAASDAVRGAVEWLQETAAGWGLGETGAELVAAAIAIVAVLVICILANLIGKAFIRGIAHHPFRHSNSAWAKAVIDQKVLLRLSQLVPIAILAFALPAFQDYGVDWWLRPLLELYVLWVLLLFTFGVLEIGEAAILHSGFDGTVPATGLSQAGKIIATFIAIVLALSVIFDKSPMWFLSGVGALAAVMMLIFKDSILGLVAGIQVSANDMVRVGDWITIPSKDVDGDVEEITLTTIRVRAFDKTVSLVPAYDLVSNPFTNWRAMSESGGRRIKRSISIDTGTIRFIDRNDLERFRKFTVLAKDLDARIADIDAWNQNNNVDTSEQINGRQQTNVGVFRAYMEAYLRQHSKIHTGDGFTFLIRHLEPGPTGLPIQIYVFTNDNRWVPYEQIQADIFDHLLAAVPEFGLAVFQSPTGQDVRSLHAE
ncbi:MAG: mechanosensitive ion channel [Phycisphaerales bacterium]|jgi:miniconductance mechanosensitive channel|nr:mechanosensitive ion channel [Phycisphaerales bacterium]